MKSTLRAAAAALVLAAPAPVWAQTVQPLAAAEAAPDPARMTAAATVVDKIFPAGSYSRMMEQAMGSTTQMMLESVGKLPLRDLAGIGGMDARKLDGLGEGTLAEIMAIYDPDYQERMKLSMQAMGSEMAVLFTRFEPDMRTGLQRAYARRFTAQQLLQINSFFNTEAGSAYAQQSLMIWMDPEVMQSMQTAMPEMMKAMPGMMEKVKAATAALPKPRTLGDLSRAERQKLAALLGVSEAELSRKR